MLQVSQGFVFRGFDGLNLSMRRRLSPLNADFRTTVLFFGRIRNAARFRMAGYAKKQQRSFAQQKEAR
jgi:hypothetical protein